MRNPGFIRPSEHNTVCVVSLTAATRFLTPLFFLSLQRAMRELLAYGIIFSMDPSDNIARPIIERFIDPELSDHCFPYTKSCCVHDRCSQLLRKLIDIWKIVSK